MVLAARWRQENYFRFGRERFALDTRDSCASGDDDATRLVPDPAKAKDKLVQDNARSYRDAVADTVTATMLATNTPALGVDGISITNQINNDIHAPLLAAKTTAAAASLCAPHDLAVLGVEGILAAVAV